MEDAARWILVASNGGSDDHPAWWLNLRANPEATIEVGRETIPVTAQLAQGDERAQLWSRLTRYNPVYASYQKITDRRIPVVILERRG